MATPTFFYGELKMYLLLGNEKTFETIDVRLILFGSGLSTVISTLLWMIMYWYSDISIYEVCICILVTSLVSFLFFIITTPRIERNAIPLSKDRYLMKVYLTISEVSSTIRNYLEKAEMLGLRPEIYAIVTFKELMNSRYKRRNLVVMSRLNDFNSYYLVFSNDLEERIK